MANEANRYRASICGEVEHARSLVPGELLARTLGGIEPASASAREKASARWDAIAHPLGGLGTLEAVVARIAAVQGTADVSVFPRALAVFFADNGVVAEGVSQSGQDVTLAVARNMCEGATSACRMASFAACSVAPIDVGMSAPVDDERMICANVARGSGNIACDPAMSRDDAVRAIEVGIACARGLARAGVRLVAGGEMSIGNTTTSTAVASMLLGVPAASLVGRGAGLDAQGLARKRAAVERAVRVNDPDASDAIDVIAKVGGFDIAALCGFYLGAASQRIPAVLDGVISCTAALAAVRLNPLVSEYLIGSHSSSEPAARLLLGELSLEAPLSAGMHLGEGAGAMAFLPLIDSALSVYCDGKTFSATGMEAYHRFGDAE